MVKNGTIIFRANSVFFMLLNNIFTFNLTINRSQSEYRLALCDYEKKVITKIK